MSKEQPISKFIIKLELADAIYQYLGTKPFIEVEKIILDMRKMEPIKEDFKLEVVND